MLLYHPLEIEELRLVYQAGMREFPRQKTDQAGFRASPDRAHAAEIARRAGMDSQGQAGFVARFRVSNGYARELQSHMGGSRERPELCLPLQAVVALNQKLEGRIDVVAAFFGEGYVGCLPDGPAPRVRNATEQFLSLLASVGDSGFYMAGDMTANSLPVFLNFFFWEQHDFAAQGVTRTHRDGVLQDLRRVWASGKTCSVPLGIVE